MEVYFEQIYLLTLDRGYTRVTDVADALQVHTSSVSRMAKKLGDADYIIYEKYGRLSITHKGAAAGKQLLKRHELLECFLDLIGVPDSLIKDEVECMEHYVSWSTVYRLQKLVQLMSKHPQLIRELQGRTYE